MTFHLSREAGDGLKTHRAAARAETRSPFVPWFRSITHIRHSQYVPVSDASPRPQIENGLPLTRQRIRLARDHHVASSDDSLDHPKIDLGSAILAEGMMEGIRLKQRVDRWSIKVDLICVDTSYTRCK